MTTATPSAHSRALASLQLPGTGRLTPAQLRSANCVWCGTELQGDTAVDLGQRYDSILGVVGRWFPRGCRHCTLKPILTSYNGHLGTCKQCMGGPALCQTRRALRALARELRR
ncbi:hypothetical protein [Streptomyces sp. NPDC002671]